MYVDTPSTSEVSAGGVASVARKARHGIGDGVELSFSCQRFLTFDLKLKSSA